MRWLPDRMTTIITERFNFIVLATVLAILISTHEQVGEMLYVTPDIAKARLLSLLCLFRNYTIQIRQ